MNSKIKNLLICLMCTLSSSVALASDKETNSDTAKDGTKTSESMISKLNLARNLAIIASENKDAVLMVAAAKLEASIPTTETARDKTSEKDSDGDVDKKTSKSQSLFAQARELAEGDANLLAVIDSTENSANGNVKGRTSGAALTTTRVKAHASDIFKLSFRGGEKAEVAIIGDRDTDLDLYVYDENGNRVCSSTTTKDTEYCRWHPKWTGIFIIKVKNLGSVYNQYKLGTN